MGNRSLTRQPCGIAWEPYYAKATQDKPSEAYPTTLFALIPSLTDGAFYKGGQTIITEQAYKSVISKGFIKLEDDDYILTEQGLAIMRALNVMFLDVINNGGCKDGKI